MIILCLKRHVTHQIIKSLETSLRFKECIIFHNKSHDLSFPNFFSCRLLRVQRFLRARMPKVVLKLLSRRERVG